VTTAREPERIDGITPWGGVPRGWRGWLRWIVRYFLIPGRRL